MEKENKCFPLSSECKKLTVMDMSTGKEIAVVTNDMIITASNNIVVKLQPTN
jgi:predicted RNA-binding protein with EMAP domain